MSKPNPVEWILISEWSLAGLEANQGGRPIPVQVRKKRLCVAKFEDTWHAFDAKCPHSGGPLAGGWINESGHVVCPWHRFEFDIRDGKCANAGFYIDSYPTKSENGQLYVGLPKRKFLGIW